MRVIAVGVVVGLLQGCSLAFVSGPPSEHASMRDFACTEDGAGPAADTAFGVSSVLSAIVSAGSDERGSDTATVTNVAMAIAFGASAIYGITMTYDCRSAQQAARARRTKTHDAQVQRIAELEQSLQANACTVDADCRADRVCHQDHCIAVPPPPAAPATPHAEPTVITLDPPASPTEPPPPAIAPSGDDTLLSQ